MLSEGESGDLEGFVLVILSSEGRHISNGTTMNWKPARTRDPISTFFHMPLSLLLAPRFTRRKTSTRVVMTKGRIARALAKSWTSL